MSKKDANRLTSRKLNTPLGRLTLIGDGHHVEFIALPDASLPERYSNDLSENDFAYPRAEHELKQYFQRRRTRFSFPLRLKKTGFQRKALEALAQLEYGRVISYRELARRAGSPLAYRAAGSACANNPLPIVIPCHRVLKSDGSLGGYGGGLELKRQLLALEQAQMLLLDR